MGQRREAMRVGLLALMPGVMVLTACGALSAQGFGSELGDAREAARFGFALDNDVKELSGTSRDGHYSGGIRLWSLAPKGEWPRFLPAPWRAWLGSKGTWSSGGVVGQQIFTPENIKDPNPQPQDRPWAGWLYAGGLARCTSAHHLGELEMTLGVVGPGSGGRQVQSEFHRLIRSPRPAGWDHQILSKATFQSRLDYTYLDGLGSLAGQVLEGHINLGLRAGNVLKDVHGGLALKFGNRPTSGSIPVAESTWSGPWGWYVYAKWGVHSVQRDLLIQGSTPAGTSRLELKHQVQEMAAGAAIFIPLSKQRTLELVVRRVRRTEEFAGQQGPQQYGTLSMVWHTKR